jgi:hypothetical protein
VIYVAFFLKPFLYDAFNSQPFNYYHIAAINTALSVQTPSLMKNRFYRYCDSRMFTTGNDGTVPCKPEKSWQMPVHNSMVDDAA